MILIDRTNYQCSDDFLKVANNETDALINLYNIDPDTFIDLKSKDLFKSSIYACDEIKKLLKGSQKSKCGFCESIISSVSYPHVEHFRPKGAWIQDKINNKLMKPGYFMLAYNYNNLILSCGICNVSYKQNYFPLQYSEVRDNIDDKYDHSLEDALLINPILIDPKEHIVFLRNYALYKSISGGVSIDYYGLNRESLLEARLEKYNLLFGYANLINKQPDNITAKEIFKELYDETVNQNKTYVAMTIDNFQLIAEK